MSPTALTVTADNFIRVESDAVFTGLVAQGGFGKFQHNRDVTSIDSHVVQRANRDTLYSTGVFDLDAGPVTITLPDAGARFLTMIVIDEDHYVFNVTYGAGTQTFSKENVGTRYAVAAIRILVDPNDPKDVEQVHALQDAVTVVQRGGPGKFEVPSWDPASHERVRDALTTLGETIPDWRRAAGRRGEVDAVRHLIVTATGWGLNPDKDAIYLNVTPSRNDGETVHSLNVKDVPVNGFWSISVYNRDGYFEKNDRNAYSLNSVTSKKDADGSVTIQFGGCDGKVANCLPITPGWNYMVRLYHPRSEILDGTWTFPEAKAVENTLHVTERAILRRAIEAINWGMPAVNFDLMLQAMIVSAKGEPNQIAYWSRLPDWKIQTLTPNADVIYLKAFFNTKDVGAMVLEIPPADGGSITGTIMDAWQSALEDVGPAGVDKGKGGKYLILPPDYKGVLPDGYIALASMTYQGYALLRSIPQSGSDAGVAAAVSYAKRIKFYPFSQAGNPPATTFHDVIDVVYDSTIPYDVRFFQSLDRIVQIEPWLTRHEVMIDLLKSIGIEKGRPFNPDARTREILDAAAREAKAWLDAR